MGSKPPDLTPENPVSTKRGRFDTIKSPTMVYVRRKIDHDQPNKPSPSSGTAQNDGGGSAKEPNLGIIEEKKEPDLECHEPSLEAELNESKDTMAKNLVENKENDSTLNPKGEQIESQSDSELNKMKVGALVNLADVATVPKLESELHGLDVGAPIELTIGEKEPNLSPNEEKSEPDLVCHETNLDAELVDVNIMASDQVISVHTNENADLQQQKIAVPIQVTNGERDKKLGENEPKLGSITPTRAMTDGNNKPGERENFRERFAKLQTYLKDCDRSRQDDYIRMLRSLSAVGRSKHASELEKRAMDLLMEEGKELRRMDGLHILGKDWLNDKTSVPTKTNFRRQL